MRDFFRVNYNADGGAGGGDSSAGGDQGAGDKQAPGWISALPDEFKTNDYVKGFEKPGDFVAAALALKAEHEGLKPRLEKAIFKPGEDATDEQRAAYYKALGVPESADGYEFPKGEGIEHDEKMIGWAKETFKAANLNTEQASTISKAWDGFMQGMAEAQKTAEAEGIKTADDALKAEWKSDYDKNIAETQRGYQAFEKTVPGFAEFLSMETTAGIAVGNHPMMLKVFHTIGQAIGDDMSLASLPRGEKKESKPGLQGIYTNSPAPPTKG